MIKNHKIYSILAVIISFLLIGGFLYGEKKRGFSGFEFSIGAAFPTFSDLTYKNDNIKGEGDDILAFYKSAGWKSSWDSTSGELNDLKYMIPINGAAIFTLNDQLTLKAGVELSFGDIGGLIKHKAGDPDNDISVDFQTKTRVCYLMPYIGIEYNFSKKISLYSTIGLGMANLDYSETFDLKNGSEIYYLNSSDYSGTGTGIGLVFGGKINLRKDFFLKIEYVLYKTGMSGDLEWSKNSWKEGLTSGKVSGDFYTYENNYTYSGEWVKDWSVFSSSSPQDGIRNLEKMNLNFSSIRIILGFYLK